MNITASHHDYCNQTVGIAKTESGANAELDFVVDRLYAGVGKPCIAEATMTVKLRLILRWSSLKLGIQQRCAQSIHLFNEYTIPSASAFRARRKPSFNR